MKHDDPIKRIAHLLCEIAVVKDLLRRAPIIIEDWDNIPQVIREDYYRDVKAVLQKEETG